MPNDIFAQSFDDCRKFTAGALEEIVGSALSEEARSSVAMRIQLIELGLFPSSISNTVKHSK
ncbi:MAG: hypothetical protein ACJ05G_12390 [Actinomycetota bacterium]